MRAAKQPPVQDAPVRGHFKEPKASHWPSGLSVTLAKWFEMAAAVACYRVAMPDAACLVVYVRQSSPNLAQSCLFARARDDTDLPAASSTTHPWTEAGRHPFPI